MKRLPTFEANVTAPLIRLAILGEYTPEDLRGVAAEIKAFACPECGHGTMDHSWTPQGPRDLQPCLKTPCECSGEFGAWINDELLIAETDAYIDQLFGVELVELNGDATQLSSWKFPDGYLESREAVAKVYEDLGVK